MRYTTDAERGVHARRHEGIPVRTSIRAGANGIISGNHSEAVTGLPVRTSVRAGAGDALSLNHSLSLLR